ncbi:basic helix-loop-helix (bHLH) DNA-binding superfamily protein [Euphorbia peplus]|nr:basic helix-loop-helix (bHLH) DNA-binding superfamily protein [Euphorbia peplus]
MESTNYNLHHHQLQSPQLASSSSSSLSTPPSTYATSAPTSWPQNYALNNTVGLNPIRQKHEISNPHFNNLMVQDFGNFHWNTNNILNHDLGKIKEELSSESFPKFTEMLSRNTVSSEDSNFLSSTNYIKDDNQQKYMNDLSEKLLLKTISSGFPINNGNQFSAYNNCPSYGRGGNFMSQIYPSINISNLNRSPPPPPQISPGAFDMNLQALDLLTSTRFSGNFEQPFHDYLGNVMQSDTHHIPSCNPSKITSSALITTSDQISEAKRPSNSFSEPKATQAAPKKSRLESRASCPPFKVRKEKLGDRIAALQQLVAPFGKTDTASVLMEAIGYIKFLQNQVETLSVPYMKSSRNKNSRSTQAFQATMEEGNDERKRDLRSRGLCLVPLSCMSYVTGDGGGGSGGGIWPPGPNFGGGT